MAINNELADGLDEIESDFPSTFIWNSTAYKGIAGSESRAVAAGEYGLQQIDSLTLLVQMAQFGEGSRPQERHPIIFNSRTYRIEGIEKSPQDAFQVFRCERTR